MDVPERRADGLGEVALGHEDAVDDRDRQLWQWPRRRAERRPGASEDVERRLVARADQRTLRRAVQPDRAAGVGAYLGVGDETVRRPLRRLALQLEAFRRDVDQWGLSVAAPHAALRKNRQNTIDRDRLGHDRLVVRTDDARTLSPGGPEQAPTGRGPEREDRDRERRSEPTECTEKPELKGAATGEALFVDHRVFECRLLLGAAREPVALLDTDVVRHQLLGPHDDPYAEPAEASGEEDPLQLRLAAECVQDEERDAGEGSDTERGEDGALGSAFPS